MPPNGRSDQGQQFFVAEELPDLVADATGHTTTVQLFSIVNPDAKPAVEGC